MALSNPCIAKWRITEMEQWDQDCVDLLVPGHFTFYMDVAELFDPELYRV